MPFSHLGLSEKVLAAVAASGYQTPTPIQDQAIPHVLARRDVLGIAQTGTGKTAAFVLPMLTMLEKGRARARMPRTLILEPTRELAAQVEESFSKYGANHKLNVALIIGGVSFDDQDTKLMRGVDVLIATPGRLLDHINQKTIDLSHIEVLVLDEADRMFDMGFLPDVRRIIKHLPTKRQTLMFSATMAEDIRKLAHEVLHKPVTVQIGHTAPVNTVAHALYPVDQHLKTALLLELLKQTDTESILIFTRTKHRAKRLGQQLDNAGYKAASLQGNLSQNRRQAALDGFRDGTHQILVATDIAARGIDVSSISHVINYDMPDTTDAYTHRIGRTGRAAKTGDAFTFVTYEDEPLVRSIERVMGEKIERRTLKGFNYSKPAPAKDKEFARPPREPRHRTPSKPELGAKFAASRSKAQGDRTEHGSSHRGASPANMQPAPTKRTFKPRTHR